MSHRLEVFYFLPFDKTDLFVSAFGRAMHLAKEIIFHPQQCLKVDRDSAYHAMYSAKNLEKALQFEGDNALGVISVVILFHLE